MYLRRMSIINIVGISLVLGVAAGYIDSKSYLTYNGEKVKTIERYKADKFQLEFKWKNYFNYSTAIIVCVGAVGILLFISEKKTD